MSKIEELPLPERVALLYNFFMRGFERLKVEKPLTATPIEFALSSATELAGFMRNDSQADLLGITLIYQRAVYGAGNVSEEGYNYVRDYYLFFQERTLAHGPPPLDSKRLLVDLITGGNHVPVSHCWAGQRPGTSTAKFVFGGDDSFERVRKTDFFSSRKKPSWANVSAIARKVRFLLYPQLRYEQFKLASYSVVLKGFARCFIRK